MANNLITLDSFTKGLLSPGQENCLDFPPDGLSSGQNIDISVGLETREGSTLVSDGSLPYGTVRAMKQVRFPGNETSKIVAQVDYSPIWLAGADGIARTEHSAVWDTARGRMLVFSGSMVGGGINEGLYEYDPETDVWAEVIPVNVEEETPVPAPRYQYLAAYDPTTDCMYITLGNGNEGKLYDTWQYDCTANEWTELTTTGTPPENLVGCYHTTGRWFFVFEHGYPGPTSYFKLDMTTLVWSEVATTYSGTGTDYPNADNYSMRVVYDATNGVMVAFGGGFEVPALQPAILDIADDSWSLGTAFPDPSGKSGFGAICCGGIMVCTGGAGFGGESLNLSGSLSIYTVATGVWSIDIPQGSLAERGGHSIVITDTSVIIEYGGLAVPVTYPHVLLSNVYVLENNICNGLVGGHSDLYASDDLL